MSAEPAASHPIDVLQREHLAILDELEGLRAEALRLESGEGLRADYWLRLFDFLEHFADELHGGKEEDLLFPELAAVLPRPDRDVVERLRAEHEMLRRDLAAVLSALERREPGALASAARAFAERLHDHVATEESVLFPAARRALDVEAVERLRAGFAAHDRHAGRLRPREEQASLPARDAIATLVAEHVTILGVLTEMEDECRSLDRGDEPRLGVWSRALRFLASFDEGLHHQKEELLFPALIACAEDAKAPVNLLRSEHDRAKHWRESIERGIGLRDSARLRGSVQAYIEFQRQHIAKEDQILFPLARRLLAEPALADLGRAFAARDEGDDGAGASVRDACG